MKEPKCLQQVVSFMLVDHDYWWHLSNEMDKDEMAATARTAELLVIECDELQSYLKWRSKGKGHTDAIKHAMTEIRRKLGCGG